MKPRYKYNWKKKEWIEMSCSRDEIKRISEEIAKAFLPLTGLINRS